jgi:thioredoxin reductase
MAASYDVVIVGGGAAGLSAALVLGRCRRSVLLFDDGQARNAASHAIHCLLGHEGLPPRELIARARAELKRYATVAIRSERVTEIVRNGLGFYITCADGSKATARKILLATGLKDDVPEIEGIERLYGRSVHHCPYCDGFEHRDKPIAVYGAGDKGAGLALMMKQWSDDVILFTGGLEPVSPAMFEKLDEHGIGVRNDKIAKLEGTSDGALRTIHLEGGEVLERSALFFTTGCKQQSDLWASLGCARDEKGGIVTTEVTEESSAPGVYVAGDASRDVLLVAVAIAEGAKAGVAINRALLKDDGLA